MFRFHLVKYQPFEKFDLCFQFITSPRGPGGTWITARIIGDLPVEIESEDDGESKELCELKEQMEGYRTSELEWELMVKIGFDEWSQCSGKQKPEDFIVVQGRSGGKNILAKLVEVLGARGLEVKMKVKIKDFGTSQGDKINVWTAEEDIGALAFGKDTFRYDHLQYSGVLDRDLWRNMEFGGVITVSCVAKECIPKAMPSFHGSGTIPNRILRKMLEEGLHSDATIISTDGEEIKCHKFILAGHSDVLEAMFRDTSRSTTSTPGVVQMDDLCSKSVKALLAYLYFDDIGQAADDSATALDLFMAAHQYDISILEGKMKQLLSSKPDGWFNVEVAMRLYFFVKNLEDSEELKKKALVFMKKNRSALNILPAYIQLSEEPEAGRQLRDDLMAFV